MTRSLLLLFVALSMAACQTKPSASQTAPTPTIALVVNAGTPVKDGLPNFTWKGADGKEVSFADISKGRPVLVNIWATWCGPCVRETPDLVELHKEFSDKGAVFIGISADEGDDAMDLVKEFAAKFKVPYQLVVDNNGELQRAIGDLRGYPTTIYLDRNGKEVKRLLGMQPKERFAEELKPLL